MPLPLLSADELRTRLAFWRVSGVGPKLFQECLTQFGSMQALFREVKSLPDALQALIHAADWRSAEKDLDWLTHENHHLLLQGSPAFPEQLAEIQQAPPLLFVKGDPECLKQKQIAMVGSRNPTSYGVKVAENFAYHLALAGLTVTSGLAIGIDGICHQAAVKAEKPTIAVLAVGLDNVYPKRHQGLAEKILTTQGALVSEFGVGVAAAPENFPRRNRLISGLSLGTVVVEATMKSGSLITARYAVDQGREVFAVPGSIFQPLAQGCHGLIQQGAKCVQSAQEVLEELNWHAQAPAQIALTASGNDIGLSKEEKYLLKLLNEIAQSYDSLFAQLDWPPQKLQALLSQLILKGLVRHSWHGYERV